MRSHNSPSSPSRAALLTGRYQRVRETVLAIERELTDFLRRRIIPKDIKVDFSSALATALKLAKTKEAGYLPGRCGPVNGAA